MPDNSGIFWLFYRKLWIAPMAEECPVNIECMNEEIEALAKGILQFAKEKFYYEMKILKSVLELAISQLPY